MEKSSNPGMFSLPFEIQRRYHHLMNSKEEFSKRLTNAEKWKLATLYEQLNAVWNRMLLDEPRKHLEQRSRELRRMQCELETNSEEFEKNCVEELKINLQRKSEALKQMRQNCTEISKKLASDVQTWKVDIEQNELCLKELRVKYDIAQTKLQHMRHKLSILSMRNERVSSANLKRADDYIANMKAQKLANDSVLNPRKDGLKQRNRALQEKKRALCVKKENFLLGLSNKNWPHLPSIAELLEKQRLASEKLCRVQAENKKVLTNAEKRLSESLKKDEHNLLEKAWSKLIDQQPRLNPESKQYLTSEGRLLGMKKIRQNGSDLKKHGEALRHALTKAGINPEDFLAQFEAHCATECVASP